jgi:hypothetical protein
MAIFRMYTGDDGHTHIEETPLADHPNLSEIGATKGVYLHTLPDEYRSLTWRPSSAGSWLSPASWRSPPRMNPLGGWALATS